MKLFRDACSVLAVLGLIACRSESFYSIQVENTSDVEMSAIEIEWSSPGISVRRLIARAHYTDIGLESPIPAQTTVSWTVDGEPFTKTLDVPPKPEDPFRGIYVIWIGDGGEAGIEVRRSLRDD